jgi:L-ascorbate metabolism protein UlaG (beta-lactamase superfamily)
MRLRLGRPDISSYRRYFDVPGAGSDAAVTVTWMGVSTLLVDDGTSALLTDGFFSRPGLIDVALRKLRPSASRIDEALRRAGVDELVAVLPVHTHYDHALDTAVVAQRTRATVVGGRSAANIARGQGLAESAIIEATPGRELDLGPYGVTLIESHHCPPDRFPGVISDPVVPPVRAAAYRCGEAWSTLIHHRPSGRRLLIQGSAGFVPGALAGRHADVVYLGVGQLGVQPERYIRQYWNETVRSVGARRVVLIHWDDFFHPLTEPLRAIPYAADDLDVTMRVLSALAERDGVAIHLPTPWQRADPWIQPRSANPRVTR